MKRRHGVRTASVGVCAMAGVLLSTAIEAGAQGAAQMPRDRAPVSAPAAGADEETRLKQTLDADPSNVDALRRLAAFYKRAGSFDLAVQSLEKIAALRPADAEAHHLVGTWYFEKTRDQSLPPATKQAYVERGIAAETEALAINPAYVDALVYKNLFLRVQATGESDPAKKQALIAEADALRNKALQLRAGQATEVPDGTVVPTGAVPPPPPPPPPPGAPPAAGMKWVYANTTYTAAVGAAPVRTKEVKPIYPPMAMSNGIEGTVVLEATIDPRGRVSQVKVVQSLPLLTQSTIDAVRQWQFDPASVGANESVVTVTAVFAK